jgi:hypothetical protein
MGMLSAFKRATICYMYLIKNKLARSKEPEGNFCVIVYFYRIVRMKATCFLLYEYLVSKDASGFDLQHRKKKNKFYAKAKENFLALRT